LQFLQIQLPTACWRNFFIPHQRYEIPIVLSINLLGNYQHFPILPILVSNCYLAEFLAALGYNNLLVNFAQFGYVRYDAYQAVALG